MPNWCSNNITIDGPVGTVTNIHYLITSSEDSLMALRPRPENIGDDWYSWSVQNWGTKWEMDPNYVELNDINDQVFISVQGDTAWSPPVELLRYISERFTDVKCHITFYEQGMDYVGAATCINGEVFESESSISGHLPGGEDFDWDSDDAYDIVYETIDKLLQHHEDVVNDQLTVKGTI